MLVTLKVVVRGEGVEDLARVGEVGLEGEDAGFGVRELDEVEVEDLVSTVLAWVCTRQTYEEVVSYLVSLLEELRNDMAAGLARAASKYDSLSSRSHCESS